MRGLLFTSILLSAVFLSGCNQPTPNTTTTDTPAAEQKVGTTTKTGTITQTSGRFFLQEAGQQPEEIESYSVDLSGYVGQTVTVTGQFSGNTLFVGEVQ
jgi:PBP1b-binding outer membrane lipoprotein LpoB